MKAGKLTDGMVEQHKAIPGRKWAWDFAWPEFNVLAELHGGEFARGKKAHATGTGMRRDAEKANAANLAGWTVLAFTGTHLERDSTYVIETVRRALRLFCVREMTRIAEEYGGYDDERKDAKE